MQYFDDRIYIVTTDGFLACLDASETAIEAARVGKVPEANLIKAPTTLGATPSTTLETTSDSSNGVILECVADGSKLRIRVVSSGYHQDWNVQFPKDIRKAGDRYWVQEIRESEGGNFYRVYGDIKKLI
jgi:hypothetical protein